MPGPYNEIKIIDLCDGIAGSYACMLLAELGAEVIKVEPPQGSALRKLPGFHVWNRSKHSVVIDLKQEKQEAIRLLLAEADVVIADFLPREALELHLAYNDVASINPRVIYCAMPPLGNRGPYANVPVNDDLVAAYGGIMASQWAYREGPVYINVPLASYGAALLAAGAVGAALYTRERMTKGQQVEVSWLAGALAAQFGHLCISEPVEESPYQSRDPLGGVSPFYRLYKASDDWIFIAPLTPSFFGKLCIALGVPDLVSDPRCINAPLGVPTEHHPALKKIVAEIIKTKPRNEWMRILKENDVPCAPVMTHEEFIDHPQIVHNGMRVEVDDPELGKTIQMGVPIKLSKTPGSIQRAAPTLGQHTKEIVSKLNSGSQPHPIPGQSYLGAALAGVRVVDFGTFYAGSGVGRLLADMGAEVVKVENFTGDPIRAAAYSFVSMNRGKRSISIDLTSPEGHEIVRRLVENADIVVENFRPGVTKRLNINYQELQQINPKIIYCSATSYGSDGPYGSLPGFDPLIQAMSGMMGVQGGRGKEPVYFYIGIMDHVCVLTSVYGISAALHHRERTGEGQLVETNIINAGLTVQSGSFIFYPGKPAEPDGGPDLLGLSALRRLYLAQDGWLMLAVQNNEHWLSFVQAIDRLDLAENYNADDALLAPRDGDLSHKLEEIFSTRVVNNWLQVLGTAGVPCAPVMPYRDIYYNSQIEANELFAIEDHPEWGKLWVTGSLIKFSDTPGGVRRGSPILSEHTDEVLQELGYDLMRIEKLRECKVVL
ncbi:CaiB/BaiF CoA transferase family protein [Chloroflexota bacterium]